MRGRRERKIKLNERVRERKRGRERGGERERPRFLDDSGHKHAHDIFMNKFSV